jgi:putative transposase
MRYIELNPLRAGIVTHPADYPWSSYRYNGLGQPDDFLDYRPNPVAAKGMTACFWSD